LTVRLHCKRLARLTLAFSKKLETSKLRLHCTLRIQSRENARLIALHASNAAGIEQSHLTVENLIEFAA